MKKQFIILFTFLSGLIYSQSTTKSFTSTAPFNNTDLLQNYNAIRLMGTSTNTQSAETNSLLSVIKQKQDTVNQMLRTINKNIDSVNMVIVKTLTFTTTSNTVAYTLNNVISYTNVTAPCFSVDIGINNVELVGISGVTTHTNMPTLYITLYNRSLNMPGDNNPLSFTFSDLHDSFIGAALSNFAWLQTTQPRALLFNWNSTGNIQYIKPILIQGSKLYFILQNQSGTAANPNTQYSFTFIFRRL